MVAITRKVGETLRIGDVFFRLLKIYPDEIEVEVLSSHPIYIPYRHPPDPTYLGEPEIFEVPEETFS